MVAPGVETAFLAGRRRLELLRPRQAAAHRRAVPGRVTGIDPGGGGVQQPRDTMPGRDAGGRIPSRGQRGGAGRIGTCGGPRETRLQPGTAGGGPAARIGHGHLPLRKALEVDLAHLAPVDEERLESDSSRGSIEAQPELSAKCVRLDAGEDMGVQHAGPFARRAQDSEVGGHRVRTKRMDERAGQQGDDRDHHGQTRHRGGAPPHAARPARWRRPAATNRSPATRAA